MRFVYLLLTFLIIAHLIIMIIGGLTGIDIYKKYGTQILKGFLQFLLLLVVFLMAIAISGLGS